MTGQKRYILKKVLVVIVSVFFNQKNSKQVQVLVVAM